MKKALILGGTRFFGKRLVEKLLSNHYDVTLATRGKTKDSFGDRLRRVTVDRSNAESMHQAFQDTKWDIVYDNINYNSHDAKIAIDVFKGNVERYIYTSSLSVYEFKAEPNRENDFHGDVYPYDLQASDLSYEEGKRQAEAALEQMGGLPAVYVRFPSVLGQDDWTKRLHFHVEHVANEQPIAIPNLDARLSFITSQEAADFLYWVGNETFTGPVNACSDGAYSLHELLTEIERVTVKTAHVVPSPDKADMSPFGAPENWIMDTTKAKEAGFTFLNVYEWMPVLIEQLHAEQQA